MKIRNFAKVIFLLNISILLSLMIGCSHPEKKFVNQLGMEFVLIEKGSFVMGETNSIPADYLMGMEYLNKGDWDEHPLHEVELSDDLYFSVTEVTIEQFKKFRPDYVGNEDYAPYASAISWYDAVEFCKWLSEKEGNYYRLPTEAEWEYACRAGTTSLFWSGDTLPAPGLSNPWGLKNMHSGVAEWCFDWYGQYPAEEVTDPIGIEKGFAKVIRGGGLDRQTPFYARSANRAGIAPNFPPIPLNEMRALIKENNPENQSTINNKRTPEGFKQIHAYQNFFRNSENNQGNHSIGFRVVMASMPDSDPVTNQSLFVNQCIVQNNEIAKLGPSLEEPYFKKRLLLPTPPENTPVEKINKAKVAGIHPSFLRHQHCPALEVMPNGDILAVYFTSVSEITPDVALMAARLRFGADEWDFPSLFLDFADVDDHAPLLWKDTKDNNTIYFFWGLNKLDSGFPFQWITSTDNGATWSDVSFPLFETLIGGHSAQPINSAFRDEDGTLYVASDGIGPESVLWKSSNNGKTWSDNGGRSGGRHTSFVLLKDGKILGMGGKSSDIDGYMPKSISTDKGKTYTISKTPFPWLGSNQRPTLIRLKSGRLFFAGDLQNINGAQPKTIKQRGGYVALSDDEGNTWTMKKLPGAQLHEEKERREALKGATLGYSVARQAPNGLIHLITSMNEPCLHFEFNEAWILDSGEKLGEDELPIMPKVERLNNIKDYQEIYPNGNLKGEWSAGVTDDGKYLLHGTEKWYYPDGQLKWEVSFDKGQKVGTEVYWDQNGNKEWSFEYKDDGTSTLTTFWPNGNKKTESNWKNKKCFGTATEWNMNGDIINRVEFVDGVPQ